MKLNKDKIIAFSIIALGIVLYAKSEYSEYQLKKSLLDFKETQKESKIMMDTIFDSMKAKQEKRTNYLKRITNKNIEKIILNLDSINSNTIPHEIFKLNSLKELSILSSESKDGKNILYKLPYAIQFLTNLEHLDLSNSKLQKIPITIIQLKKLKSINISNTEITDEEVQLLESRIPKECLIINQ